MEDFDMRKILQTCMATLAIILASLVSMTTAHAITSGVETSKIADTATTNLYVKAFTFTKLACNIYPAITNIDICFDKVVRKILSERDVDTELQDEMFHQLDATDLVRHPAQPGDELLTESQLQSRAYAQRLFDVIDVSCAKDPAITDFTLCMDKAFHSILSSRDPHSGYMNVEESDAYRQGQSGNLEGIGVSVVFTSDKSIGILSVFEGSPAEKAGILDGDRIVAFVNGKERLPTASFTNINAAIDNLKGAPRTSVGLEILRGESDEIHIVTVARAAIKIPMVKTEILIDPNDPSKIYAHVILTQFGDTLKNDMVAAINDVLLKHQDVQGFIFDVRGNPGGSLKQVYESVDALVDYSGPFVSIRDNDGIHAYGTGEGDEVLLPQPGDVTNGLPIAVFIDGNSASAAEIFSGALQIFDRSITIGKGTWRKGSVQGIFTLVDGSTMRLNQAEYLIGSPTKWVAVQCVGVSPDIDYEAEGSVASTKQIHECDLPGAIVSGGVRSDPSMIKQPLIDRNPTLYKFGLQAIAVIKESDHQKVLRFKKIQKLLKMPEESSLEP